MSVTRFGVTPRFAAGQVLSASAHLNALHEVCQGVADDFGGLQLPFSGNVWAAGGSGSAFAFTERWAGVLRHKTNRLAWRYTISAPGEVDLLLGGQVVAAFAASTVGEHTGDADITALGLVVNQFYTVEVQAAAGAQWSLTALYEAADWTDPEPLAAFADGVTPTAADWQGLAEHAADLARRADAPCHFTLRTTSGTLTGPMGAPIVGAAGCTHLRGVLNHRARFLALALTCYPPYWSTGCEANNTHIRYVQGEVYINGVEVYRCRAGEPALTPAARVDWTPAEHTFAAVVDLQSIPDFALTQGADYLIDVVIAWAGCAGDLYARGGLHYLYEYGELGVNPAGWQPFTPWTHGLAAYGDGGEPGVSTLAENLSLLDALLGYRNYPTPRVMEDGFGLAGVRRRRYLHYRIRKEYNPAFENPTEGQTYTDDTGYPEEQAGRVRFYVAGKERTVSLSNPFQTWAVLDLDSVDGLTVGTQYFLDDVRYAVEDDTP